MMSDFVSQLRQLQLDRIKYEKQKDKNKYSHKLTKQQNKYQAYIINQMADKNRFIAATNIIDILNKNRKSCFIQFFSKIKESKIQKIQGQMQFLKTNNRQIQQQSRGLKEQTMTVDFILVKLCTDVIKRQMQRAITTNLRYYFQNIRQYSKNKNKLSKSIKIISFIYKRHSFRLMKQFIPHNLKPTTQGKIFQQDFSMIIKNDYIKKDKNCDQSYLSFILDKQNIQNQCNKCKQICLNTLNKQKQTNNIKNQLGYLKNLLVQKNIQIKLRDQQILKLKQISRKDVSQDQSDVISRNQSDYSEMQKCVFGVKRIRKNTNGSIISNQSNKQQISRQLLGKYMRQSFKLKQNIDLARQICHELQVQLPLTYRVKLQGLLKVLNLNQEMSYIDQNN